jgi:hypothetical protein
MSSRIVLPPEIQVIERPGVVRYQLPRRRPGLSVAVYLVLLVLTLAGGICGTSLIRDSGAGSIAFAFVLICSFALLLEVLSLYFGRAEVELSGDELRAIERFGPFRRTRRRPVFHVSRLVVGHLTPDVAKAHRGSLVPLANDPGMAAILVEAKGDALMLLAPGYPRAWLMALAQDLARRVNAAEPDLLSDLPAPKIEVIESAVEASGFVERAEPPAGSAIVVERHPDGVTLIVPPRGIWQGGGCGILLISLMFLGGALICVLAAAGIVHGDGDPGIGFCICLVAGLVTLFLAIGHGRRRAVLVVAGKNTLKVTNVEVFGVQERLWQREELADIVTGPSDGGINDDSLLELQIHPKTGAKFGLLAGRDACELAFLATELRRSLHLPPKEE